MAAKGLRRIPFRLIPSICARAALIGLLVAFLAPAARAQEMAFRVAVPANCRSPCAPELTAQGLIALDSADAFREAVAKVNGSPVVRIDSAGGNLVGALRLGQAFRDAGATLILPSGARCVSACVYAFLGGSTRRVASGGRMGVHRFYSEEADGGEFPAVLVRRATETLIEYVSRMGADPELVSLALSVQPPAVRYLGPNELRRYRVVN